MRERDLHELPDHGWTRQILADQMQRQADDLTRVRHMLGAVVSKTELFIHQTEFSGRSLYV